MNYAKQQHIPVGPARGAAAGSLVSYVLGITTIDPIKHNLLFERFLNPERITLPDIDIDFCIERRGEVIDYIRNKYGENSEEYGNALIFNDYWLGMILSKLKELKIYDETLVYVVSEHGFNDGMYHHNDAPYAFLATNDKTVKNNGDRKDITPTILWQYGLDLNKISPQLDGIPLN